MADEPETTKKSVEAAEKEAQPRVAPKKKVGAKKEGEAPKPTKKTAKKRRKAAGKQSPPVDKDDEQPARGGSRPYPIVPYREATKLADAIWEHAPGGRVRRLRLFELLKTSASSGPSRQLVTNSGKYGLTTGSYQNEYLELTDLGRIACDPNGNPRDRVAAQFELAIASIVPFKRLYDEYVGQRLPSKEIMYDFLDSQEDLKIVDQAECVDIFIVNIRDLGLLRTIGAAETLVPIEQALEELGTAPAPLKPPKNPPGTAGGASASANASVDWEKTCFYVTPIGDEASENRKHSDLFKIHLIEPAVKELGLEVVRADDIETSGMISTAIFQYIRNSKLVIADLSTLNPNVFYEIALRHVCKLPTVQIIQKKNGLPFDVNQVKTIIIDNTDLYSFVPQMATFIADIAATARAAIENPSQVSNPITTFYPQFWENLNT